MILVDTSVWIDHFRHGNDKLMRLLESQLVVTHPFVVGELACGSVPNRLVTLHLLDQLPKAPIASDEEVRAMVEARSVFGSGLGWVDMHLLASAQLLAGGQLWTLDRKLKKWGAER